MAVLHWTFFVYLLSIIEGVAADVCYYGYRYYYYHYSSYSYSGFSYYCDAGCCGYYYSRHCCTTGGYIVGAVIGCLFLAGLVAVFVVCLLKKRPSYNGRVIPFSTANTTNTTIIHQPPTQRGAYVLPQYPQSPPPYQQQQPTYPQAMSQPEHSYYPPVPGGQYPSQPPPAYNAVFANPHS